MPRSTSYKPELRLRTRKQIAMELSSTTNVVDRLKRDGAIPYVQVGHFVRFDMDAVKAALKKHTVDAV